MSSPVVEAVEPGSTSDGKVGAVLVVGGGVAGMQASLDLAESGYKVYLVEKGPAIGGAMAQLDKTFPTNDCAMCTLAPRLVDCGKHPNIEKLTYSELLDVQGEPGHFRARILKKARSVDADKCTGCGECMANCLVRNRAYVEPVEPERIDLPPEEIEDLGRILDANGRTPGALLPTLQDINSKYKWLKPGALAYLSAELEVPMARLLRVATFYNALNLTPKGEHTISVCMGTACYVKGGKRILETFQRELGVDIGGVTEDRKFSLETVNCLGCCGQSPVVRVDDDIYGYVKLSEVPKIAANYS
jgi:NADH:ubiquinone oxidoreductase subunit E